MEVLVALLVITVGLMGLAGLQTRSLKASMESADRLDALMLLEEISTRMQVDTLCLASDHPDEACLTGGRHPIDSTRFHPCVVPGNEGQWVVSVAWSSTFEDTIPANTCGAGVFGQETKRRVISTVLSRASG